MAFQIGCMSLDYLPKPTSDFHPHILTVSGRRQVVISVNKRFGSLADSIQQEREKKHMQLVAAGASIPPEQRYAPPEFDGRVMVFVSSVRVVYLQQFVDDLMEYIHMIKTLVHLASTESVAKFSAMGAPIERLEIDVTIQKPVCVFPRAWNSMECFEIELEAVRVSNQFRDIRLHSPNRTGPLPDSPLIERTMVEFDNMNLCTTTIVPSAKSGTVAAATVPLLADGTIVVVHRFMLSNSTIVRSINGESGNGPVRLGECSRMSRNWFETRTASSSISKHSIEFHARGNTHTGFWIVTSISRRSIGAPIAENLATLSVLARCTSVLIM